jgi:hypothetical protein
MSDKVKVSPTPIQRNAFDVATELTMRYFEHQNPKSPEEMGEVFAKFYATAFVCSSKSSSELAPLVDEKIADRFGKDAPFNSSDYNY